ncbi:MAG: HEAT repeat domain-containing protein [Lysobacter sp.]
MDMPDLTLETTRFREWAAAESKAEEGQWECDYNDWPAWHQAVLACVAECAALVWAEEDIEHVLYAIARDNDTQYLAREIRLRYPDALRFLSRAALAKGEAQSRWQLAIELGAMAPDDEIEGLLLAFATDEDEYVRRHAIRSLTATGSRAAEELAWASWHRPDDQQEWARMSVLECLRELKSPRLAPLLAEALYDCRPFLRQFAERMRDEGH